MTINSCVVCGHGMSRLDIPWVLQCDSCGMLSSSLEPNIYGEKNFSETDRLEGLSYVRQANFERILDAIAPNLLVCPGSALEVGPGQGFFMDALRKRGWRVTGVEPDLDMAQALVKSGWRVVCDRYPSTAVADETFDLVAFNDVLEHIPDVRSVMRQVKAQLSPSGAVVVNLPSANGLFYRAAATLARAGWRSPYDRMWQRGLVSPHIHYFTPRHLRMLAREEGFKEVCSGRLPALTFKGLGKRLGYTRSMNGIAFATTFCAASAAIPLAHLFPSDITYHLFTL